MPLRITLQEPPEEKPDNSHEALRKRFKFVVAQMTEVFDVSCLRFSTDPEDMEVGTFYLRKGGKVYEFDVELVGIEEVENCPVNFEKEEPL